MSFQTSVNTFAATGVPGELASDAPIRCRPGITKGTAANIVVGRWFTQDPADLTYTPGGTNAEGGLLINPKAYASIGTQAGGPLAPTLTLPAGTPGEFASAGEFFAILSTAATVGQPLFYDNTTGVLGAGTAGAGQTQIPNSRVTRYNNAAPGLTCISLSNP